MAFSKIILDGTTLIDLTQDTAKEGALVSGFTAHKNDGTQITGTLNTNPDDGDVVFIDYDGSIVTVKTKAEINAMTSDSDLPENPTHEGLTAQGWNWTVTQLKAQLTAMPDQKVYVGQMYITESGKTEIDVEMPEGRLSPILTICVNGEITVDWGDETTPDTVTGSSESTRLAVPHLYANAGNYTISISVVRGSFKFYGSTSYPLLRKNGIDYQNRVYANCIRNVRFGNGVTSIGSYAFYVCTSMSKISIPKSILTIDSYAFYYCRSLANIVIPSAVTDISSSTFSSCDSLMSIILPGGLINIGSSVFQYCYVLQKICIPHGVTNIGSSSFQSCYTLRSISIPNGVTNISSYLFYGCHSLLSIKIPNSVTTISSYAFYNCFILSSVKLPNNLTLIESSAFYTCYAIVSIDVSGNITEIESSAFGNCYGVKEYHFRSEEVPTGGSTMFNNIVDDCIIYVPQGKLSAYQSATNWSAYASYMREEPT